MKKINNFIIEKLKLNRKTNIIQYRPQTYKELRDIIKKLLLANGWNADLNIIDTSSIDDMHDLFAAYPNFNGDISDWDVSCVKNMKNMFNGCTEFDCDISNWDVGAVENMSEMFVMCKKFSCDLNKWNPKSLKNKYNMFLYTPNCKKPEWYTN